MNQEIRKHNSTTPYHAIPYCVEYFVCITIPPQIAVKIGEGGGGGGGGGVTVNH